MNDILDASEYENKEIRTASWLDRFVSTLIDVCLFFLVTYFLNDLFIGELYLEFLTSQWYIFVALMLFYIIYFQSSDKQATIGMQLMKIRLLNEDKTDVNVLTAIKRTGINIVLFFNFLFLSGTYKQSFADKACKTIVIKR
jgi:uncharacterized RDD family membrane protein YckC